MIEAQARIGTVILVEGLTKRYGNTESRRRIVAHGARGLDLRPARRKWGGQDDDDPDLAWPDQARRRPDRGTGSRPGTSGTRRAPADRLRARVAGTLRLDDRRRDRLVRRRRFTSMRTGRPAATSTATPS